MDIITTDDLLHQMRRKPHRSRAVCLFILFFVVVLVVLVVDVVFTWPEQRHLLLCLRPASSEAAIRQRQQQHLMRAAHLSMTELGAKSICLAIVCQGVLRPIKQRRRRRQR